MPKVKNGFSRTILLVAFAVGLAFLLLLVWIIPNVEIRTDTEDLGYGRAAKRNPYLAAEKYLASLGVPARSTRSLKILRDLPPTSTGLVVNDITQYFRDERAEELYAWVEGGGQLVVATRPAWQGQEEWADPFLSLLGVEVAETDCFCWSGSDFIGDSLEGVLGEETTEQFLDEADELIETVLGEAISDVTEEEARSQMTKMLLPDGLTELELELNANYALFTIGRHMGPKSTDSIGCDAPISDETPDGDENTEIMDGGESENEHIAVVGSVADVALDGSPLTGAYGSDYGQHILRYQIGEGTVTLMSDDHLWTSNNIADLDHAYLLWWLSRDLDEMVIVYGSQMPNIFRLLWNNFFEWVISGGALLTAWLVYRGRRFGAIATKEASTRRSLIEHQSAVGQFFWQHNELNALIEPPRRALLLELQKYQVGFSSKTPAQQTELIEHRYGVSADIVQLALYQSYDEQNPALFTQMIAAIQTIRNRL